MLSLLRLSSDALKDYELREKDGLAGKYPLVFMSPEKLLKPNKVPLLWCWRRWYASWLLCQLLLLWQVKEALKALHQQGKLELLAFDEVCQAIAVAVATLHGDHALSRHA